VACPYWLRADDFIGLKLLEPETGADLVTALGCICDAIFKGERFRAIFRLLPLLLAGQAERACGLDAALPPTTDAANGEGQQYILGTEAAGVPAWALP